MLIDAPRRHFIQPELTDGESILWAGRPNYWRLMLRNLPFCFVGLFWEALAIPFTYLIAHSSNSGHFVLRDTSGALNGGVLPLLIFFAIFNGAGIGMIVYPLYAYLKGHRTTYVITDQRVLIIETAPWRQVQSYSKPTAAAIRRTEETDGSGNLVVAEKYTCSSHSGRRHTIAEPVLFIGIPKVQEVENILRSAFKEEA